MVDEKSIRRNIENKHATLLHFNNISISSKFLKHYNCNPGFFIPICNVAYMIAFFYELEPIALKSTY